MDGYVGLSLLVDRESGRCIATSAWETEEAMRASTEQAAPLRDQAAEIFGGDATVDQWEIGAMHRDHRSGDGACVRATWIKVPRIRSTARSSSTRADVLPSLENLEGFCSASFLMNRLRARRVVGDVRQPRRHGAQPGAGERTAEHAHPRDWALTSST